MSSSLWDSLILRLRIRPCPLAATMSKSISKTSPNLRSPFACLTSAKIQEGIKKKSSRQFQHTIAHMIKDHRASRCHMKRTNIIGNSAKPSNKSSKVTKLTSTSKNHLLSTRRSKATVSRRGRSRSREPV